MEKHQHNLKEAQALERKIKFLDGLERRKDFPPEEVFQMLSIKKTDNIPLPADSIDIILASLVLHEIKPLSTTLQQIKRVLKDGGQFMCLEYEKDESTIEGPPMQIRVPSSVMEQELENAGLNITQKIFLRKKIYIITAQK
ncbi:class I SAM-dependent methyltransferase [Clostridium sp. JS66]|uniref:class I SAM-dependent methyltransferase n=1 Tax=Clostridium sp. JS66 TaxID=3064705 RepID=UPI00298DDFA7|nr:methyltransferase domain-containing protein [Clostridium sp. JS66]WPC42711.1 methyltransferase domain-containing protein [Clostridium sp. JS66]